MAKIRQIGYQCTGWSSSQKKWIHGDQFVITSNAKVFAWPCSLKEMYKASAEVSIVDSRTGELCAVALGSFEYSVKNNEK